VEYLPESAPSIYRRRRHRRAAITLTIVTSLLFATLVYAASYVQGWVGSQAAGPVAAACGAVSKVRPLTPRDVTINVYNTTPRAGLAAAVAYRLKRQGFKVASVDNDPLGLTVQGVGQIRHGRAGTASAVLARTRLRGATLVEDGRTDASVDVVLGSTFRKLSVPPKTTVSTKVSTKASPRKAAPSTTLKPATPPC